MNQTAEGRYDNSDPLANILEMHRRIKERQDLDDEKQ